MNNKTIILFLILFLFLSFLFLAWTETSQQSPQSQNWWVAYFQNPQDGSLNFVIENNSDQNNFHWEIFKGNDKISEGDVEINKGDKKEVPLNLELVEKNKIIIKISADQGTKEIYKIFEK